MRNSLLGLFSTVIAVCFAAAVLATGENKLPGVDRHATEYSELQAADTNNSEGPLYDLPLHLDLFEYDVSRAYDPNGRKTFLQNGWSHVKAENISRGHNGFLYTVSEIPGYSGKFPGKNSTRVLAIEARPGSMGSQTDFYLQYGDESGSEEDIVPGDVWFQFWIFPNRYDDPTDQNDQLSKFSSRFKFIYPSKSGYPSVAGQINWLFCLGFTTAEPFWANENNTELFVTQIGPTGTDIDYKLAPDWNEFKLGQTDTTENLPPNRWSLVKIHYDTSTASGTYEAWIRPLDGNWVKVSEWIDGHTPHFSWKIEANDIGGHSVFRIPTTMDDFDSWIYLDDFAMAASESALPEY